MSETPLVPIVLDNLGDIEATELRELTNAAFQVLADMPAETEGFANLGNQDTKRAYHLSLADFMTFIGSNPKRPELRIVTRAHVTRQGLDTVAEVIPIQSLSVDAGTGGRHSLVLGRG